MSVFASLRYPVSMPPTASQLEAIPDEVYNQWLTEAFGEVSVLPRSVMAQIMRDNLSAAQTWIERLQCIIYGMDE